MKKITIVIIFNLIFIFCLLILLPSVFIKTRQGISNFNSDKAIPFTSQNPVTFTVKSDKPSFEKITLEMKNPNLQNNSRIDIEIVGPTSTRTLTFYGSNINDPSKIPLKFSPFTDPSNTNYHITLTTDNSNSQGLYISGSYTDIPVFETFYRQPNFTSRIIANSKLRYSQVSQQSRLHLISYLFILFTVNYLFIKQGEA